VGSCDFGTGLDAFDIAFAPQREFLLDREEHLVLARPAGAVDFIRGDAERRIGERAGDCDARLSPCSRQIIAAIIQSLRRTRQYLIGHGEQLRYARVAQTILDEAAMLLACHKATIAKAPQMV
jgi:hypothetical protein